MTCGQREQRGDPCGRVPRCSAIERIRADGSEAID